MYRRTRKRVDARRWSFLLPIIQYWRSQEGAPNARELGESIFRGNNGATFSSLSSDGIFLPSSARVNCHVTNADKGFWSYGILDSLGGVFSFMITGSICAIRFNIILGGMFLALSIIGLRSLKEGNSSAIVVTGKAGLITVVFGCVVCKTSSCNVHETKIHQLYCNLAQPSGVIAAAAAGASGLVAVALLARLVRHEDRLDAIAHMLNSFPRDHVETLADEVDNLVIDGIHLEEAIEFIRALGEASTSMGAILGAMDRVLDTTRAQVMALRRAIQDSQDRERARDQTIETMSAMIRELQRLLDGALGKP
ncbi:hypothetical protein CTI12_AA470020 [Artemisia annua]|uniref:Uncharacterized protein n=1 Tax=Artemisia annua TaxID=35608 RepID=A0A2U1LP42_ARTAN|nr:hypothetical protein CTI12_AA470020 [Artemisia annua]